MSHLANVLKFGWPYLRKYWDRFFLGVLLGVIFGVSNGAVLWATNTLVSRVIPAEQKSDLAAVAAGASAKLSLAPSSTGSWRENFDSWRKDLDRRASSMADPWLPAIGKKVDWHQVIGCVLLLPLIMLTRGYLGYLSSYFMAWSSERVVSDLRVNVLQRISSLSMDYFHRAPIGDLITRVTQDTASLQRTLSFGLSDLIKEPVTIISIFGILLVTDWQLTLVAFVFFPFCVLPIVVLGRKVRKAATSGRQTTVVQSSLLIEILQGIRVVKAFNQEESQTERFRRLSLDLVRHTMRGVRAKELMNPLIETVGMMGLGFVIIYIVWTERTFANMVPFLLGLVFIYTPVKRLAQLHALFQNTAAGVERLMQILREKP
ncbi:MAG TPA: ABC transporter transmembrane domain-containing protein, partial [Roseimicrobium sp.]|nr:ABC transporter transmembrane domain-containing protein [Roseimicrobium sp.]